MRTDKGKEVKEIKYGEVKTGEIFLTYFDDRWCHFIKTEDFAVVVEKDNPEYKRGRSYVFSDSYNIYVAVKGTTLTVRDN